MIGADGSGLRRLTSDEFHVRDLQWSPPGDRLVYMELPAPGREGEVFTIRADGTNRRPVTNNSSLEDTPLWAPDEERIAFRGFSTGAPAIHVINADGSNESVLDPRDRELASQRWSPTFRLTQEKLKSRSAASPVKSDIHRNARSDRSPPRLRGFA